MAAHEGAPAPRGRTRLDERTIRMALLVLGVGDLALGVWMAVSPGPFARSIGGFGTRNDHYVRDAATWSLALGAALLLSVPGRGWRVPVLFVATVQAVLHVANHVADVGTSDPGWAGPVDVALLAGQGVLFAAVLVAAARGRRRTRGRP